MQYDQDLLLGLKKGDKECFRQLFEQHYDLYLSFARGMLKDSAAAEDVVQETFMKLWVRREHIDENRSVHNFLLVIIRNAIHNYMRLRYNARRSHMPVPDIEDGSPLVDEKYIMKEMEQRIDSAIDRMPPQRKLVFTMSRKENLTTAEIAAKLGISPRTVEKHIEEALRQLRTMTNMSVVSLILLLF